MEEGSRLEQPDEWEGKINTNMKKICIEGCDLAMFEEHGETILSTNSSELAPVRSAPTEGRLCYILHESPHLGLLHKKGLFFEYPGYRNLQINGSFFVSLVPDLFIYFMWIMWVT